MWALPCLLVHYARQLHKHRLLMACASQQAICSNSEQHCMDLNYMVRTSVQVHAVLTQAMGLVNQHKVFRASRGSASSLMQFVGINGSQLLK